MPTLATRPSTGSTRPARPAAGPAATAATVIGAAVAGVLLGVVDLALQLTLPYPWADLANSSAVWALGAFAVGAVVRGGRWLPALAGVVTLVVAVEAYYLAAIATDLSAVASLWSPATVTWLVFGVAAGVVFGTAGALARRTSGALAALGLALAPAVLLGEALVLSMHTHGLDPQPTWSPTPTAAITAALALLVLLAPALAGRARQSALAAMLCLPLAVVCWGAFRVVGFGG